ncbi:catalase A [Sporothrix eucalyptigena]|uniref:Catalase A n=1 Tax=Sporothrix eucalyptigena TaxID=1812306 RepID=A0ABP0D0A3_9PEZI
MEDEEQQSSGSNTDPLRERAFKFVLDSSKQGVRSHAMVEYWKKRHKYKGEEKAGMQRLRTLLPVGLQQRSAGQPAHVPLTQPREAVGGQMSSTSASSQMSLVSTNSANSDAAIKASSLPDASSVSSDTHPTVPGGLAGLGGIPMQALTGMEHALGGSRIDPFDIFPVTLTAQHHKLLHHWLSAHATMMFEPLTASSNPMRDVWFPLDLSNAASFNAIMAHAAAHLAHQQGVSHSVEALQFKAEAVRIVNVWMAQAVLALSDQAFAAVIRLLSYERYWGTAAEWQVHRDGLQNMIASRGGFTALQSNWQLGLVTYLVSLMAKPVWFHAANDITGLAALPSALAHVTPTPFDHDAYHAIGAPVAAHKRLLRSLWLLSIVQDTRILIVSARACCRGGRLATCAALQDALRLLLADFKQDLVAHPGQAFASPAVPTPRERARIASIVLLCLLMQESVEADGADGADPTELVIIDADLQDTRPLWPSSLGLNAILFGRASKLPDGDLRTRYAENMTEVLLSCSCDAHRGVQKCLLRILCEALAIPDAHPWDESWTPDAVLASLPRGRLAGGRCVRLYLPHANVDKIIKAAHVAKYIRAYDEVARNNDINADQNLPVQLNLAECGALKRERDVAISERGMYIVMLTVSLAAFLHPPE